MRKFQWSTFQCAIDFNADYLYVFTGQRLNFFKFWSSCWNLKKWSFLFAVLPAFSVLILMKKLHVRLLLNWNSFKVKGLYVKGLYKSRAYLCLTVNAIYLEKKKHPELKIFRQFLRTLEQQLWNGAIVFNADNLYEFTGQRFNAQLVSMLLVSIGFNADNLYVITSMW